MPALKLLQDVSAQSTRSHVLHYNCDMTHILAIETSTTLCTVALVSEREGQITTTQRSLEGTSGHAANVLPLIEALLQECAVSRQALSAIAFGQGPGAFTGIRVACGVAQGLGLALGLPVLPIGALTAVAASASARHPGQLVLAALDARMDEIYFAAYSDTPANGLNVLQPPVLMAARDAPLFIMQRHALWLQRSTVAGAEPPGMCLVGEGWSVSGTREGLPTQWAEDDLSARPQAQAIATLALRAFKQGEAVPPEQAAPFYLRDKVAFTTIERAEGLGGNPRASAPTAVALLPMVSADLPEVVALEAAVQSFPWTSKNFDDALAAGYSAWVLRKDGELVGFCIAMLAPDLAHILVIAVARFCQGQGFGRQLLDQAARSARQHGAEGLLLEVRPSNIQALDFYAHQGFSQIGVRRDYYPAGRGQREDALVLKKAFEQS